MRLPICRPEQQHLLICLPAQQQPAAAASSSSQQQQLQEAPHRKKDSACVFLPGALGSTACALCVHCIFFRALYCGFSAFNSNDMFCVTRNDESKIPNTAK